MNLRKRKYAVIAPALVIIITAILLGAVVTLRQWYLVFVMIVAAVWFARIAFEDRPLTAEEKRNRACLRRRLP